MLNIAFNNILIAWRNPNQEVESEQWSKKTVTIHFVKQINKRNSYFIKCLNVLKIYFNTVCYLSQSLFKNTERNISISPGRFRAITTVTTLFNTKVFVTDPNIMQAILSHERNESGPNAMFSGGIPSVVAQKILGPNLLTFSEEEHHQIRTLISPHLHRVNRLTDHIYLFTRKALSNCSEFYEPGSFFPKFMVEIVCQCYLNYSCPAVDIAKTIETLLETVNHPERQKEFQQAQQALEVFAKEAPPNPLVNDIPLEHRLSFIKLMFFAGQDTTTALIEYLLFVLGHADEWQDKLYDLLGQSKQSIPDFVKDCSLLEWIVKEGIRLHPPSFEQTRTVLKDIIIDDEYVIQAGSEIHMDHYHSQRDMRRWGEKAQEFNPLRHENPEEKHVSLPFSIGPASCLGRHFAMTLTKIVLMTFLSKYRWKSLTQLEKLGGNVALKIIPSPIIKLTNRE